MFWVFVILTSLFIALSNLFIRKSVDAGGGEGDPYLLERLAVSGVAISLIAIYNLGYFPLNFRMGMLGIVAGVMLGSLMWSTGRTLKFGPPGLSLMVINAACVVPPILMALAFGSAYGFNYTFYNLLGSAVIVAGMLLGSIHERFGLSRNWVLWVGITFLLHSLYLTYFQYRSLLMKADANSSPLLFCCSPEGADIFGITLFASAALYQLFLPRNRKEFSYQPFLIWGIGGGIINGLGSFFMLKATENAITATEKTILFPIYLILLITFCNTWGKVIYGEKISWLSTVVIAIGILISALL